MSLRNVSGGRGGGGADTLPAERPCIPIYLRRSAPHVAPQDKLGRFVREFLGDLSADDDGSRREAARGAVKTRKEKQIVRLSEVHVGRVSLRLDARSPHNPPPPQTYNILGQQLPTYSKPTTFMHDKRAPCV